MLRICTVTAERVAGRTRATATPHPGIRMVRRENLAGTAYRRMATLVDAGIDFAHQRPDPRIETVRGVHAEAVV